MIDPQSLRLSNIIKVRDEGKWRTAFVSSVSPSWIIAKNPYIHLSGPFDQNKLHGAYLSDDWLVDNGWDPVPGTAESGEELFASSEPDECTRNLRIAMKGGTFRLLIGTTQVGSEFTSIHELQNLFFYATGRELLSDTTLKITISMAAPLPENRGDYESD